jgi:hypothetical protein
VRRTAQRYPEGNDLAEELMPDHTQTLVEACGRALNAAADTAALRAETSKLERILADPAH